MLRLLVFSDLHLEHRPLWTFPAAFPPYDVAVIAGDLAGSVADSVRLLKENPILREKPALLVPGNHEFYGTELFANLADGVAAAAGSNVTILHRRAVILGGVRFLGATLWTDYALDGSPGASMARADAELNDHRLITIRRGAGEAELFTPVDACSLHYQDRSFLEQALAELIAARRWL